MKKCFFPVVLCCFALTTQAQFTRQDSLRGSNSIYRDWWDVTHYTVNVTPDYNNKSIAGSNTIKFMVVHEGGNKTMQIDMQQPMTVENIKGTGLTIKKQWREGNVYFIDFGNTDFVTKEYEITISFKGIPVAAKRPPWDGGWIWQKDAKGNPWMSVACQGLGASVWYPCKDYQGDEPDRGATLIMNVPDTLSAIGNGRLLEKKVLNGIATWTWEVKNPINNYNIIPYIGKYDTWNENYKGEKGILTCQYWVLDYNLAKAKSQFKQAAMTLRALEHWFGPYPFYEDGFKLVEAPHLGMEHQSAVAYGNGYQNGYRGRDLSQSGWGLLWDFIIVHETGHEWFGNNITTNDIADMWVHEGFTNYSETLFTDYHFGVEAGNDYVIGTRKLIANDKNIIGPYGVNEGGSGDMYYKGGNLLHSIRQLVKDDEKFRKILRGLNSTFYHRTVTTRQVEDYISSQAGMDLSKIFDQYLRSIKIPELEYKVSATSISFRWVNAVEGFNMPVKLSDGTWLNATTSWKELPVNEQMKNGIVVDRNFYITVKKVDNF
jgi:aminopeptidase N